MFKNKTLFCLLLISLIVLANSFAAEPPIKFKKKAYKVPSYAGNVVLERLTDLNLEVNIKLTGKVKSTIKEYTVLGRKSAEDILGKTTRYFPAFDYYNDDYGVPNELKCLMIIESSLDPMVVSSSGARGLWQLMPSTARSYGLQINDYVDERCDPYKSTEAALKHLSHLYEEFENWTLAIAAYNCGSKRVKQAIKKSKSKNFWKLKKHLPKQTQDYINKFIAANYVVNYYMFYDLRPKYPDYTYQLTEPIVVFKFDKLRKIALREEIDLEVLFELNPSYVKGIVPLNDEGNIVILPKVGGKIKKQTASLQPGLKGKF